MQKEEARALKREAKKAAMEVKEKRKWQESGDMQLKSKLAPYKEKQHFENEVTILKRLLQLEAIGHNIDLEETIGHFECAKAPPSLFDANEQMRHGNKSVWFTALQKETSLQVRDSLPDSDKRTAVVVDAMSFIQQYQFLDGETFREYQSRLHRVLMRSLPNNTNSVHLPGDRYDHVDSTKEVERQRRYTQKPTKEYEINETTMTPSFKDFMTSKTNKARLQHFLCSSWEMNESQWHNAIDLYMSGGFLDESKSIRVSASGVLHVPHLQSTQEECDTRVLLHAIFQCAESWC